MLSRYTHVIQPYWVGTKDRKSLAFIIPSQIVKEQNFDTSTVFAMRATEDAEIILKVIDTRCKVKEEQKENMMTIADDSKSFEASGSQQISSPFLSQGVQ
jgi:hypothetical protein